MWISVTHGVSGEAILVCSLEELEAAAAADVCLQKIAPKARASLESIPGGTHLSKKLKCDAGPESERDNPSAGDGSESEKRNHDAAAGMKNEGKVVGHSGISSSAELERSLLLWDKRQIWNDDRAFGGVVDSGFVSADESRSKKGSKDKGGGKQGSKDAGQCEKNSSGNGCHYGRVSSSLKKEEGKEFGTGNLFTPMDADGDDAPNPIAEDVPPGFVKGSIRQGASQFVSFIALEKRITELLEVPILRQKWCVLGADVDVPKEYSPYLADSAESSCSNRISLETQRKRLLESFVVQGALDLRKIQADILESLADSVATLAALKDTASVPQDSTVKKSSFSSAHLTLRLALWTLTDPSPFVTASGVALTGICKKTDFLVANTRLVMKDPQEFFHFLNQLPQKSLWSCDFPFHCDWSCYGDEFFNVPCGFLYRIEEDESDSELAQTGLGLRSESLETNSKIQKTDILDEEGSLTPEDGQHGALVRKKKQLRLVETTETVSYGELNFCGESRSGVMHSGFIFYCYSEVFFQPCVFVRVREKDMYTDDEPQPGDQGHPRAYDPQAGEAIVPIPLGMVDAGAYELCWRDWYGGSGAGTATGPHADMCRGNISGGWKPS